MCLGLDQHRRKETGRPSSDHQSKYCNMELNSSEELDRHHMEKPILCTTRIFAPRYMGVILAVGRAEHYRKDNHQKRSLGPYSDIWC